LEQVYTIKIHEMKSKCIAIRALVFGFLLIVSFTGVAQPGQSKENGFYYISSIDFLYDAQNGGTDLQPLANNLQNNFAFIRCSRNEQKKTISVNLYNKQQELVTTELYAIGNLTRQKTITVTDDYGRKTEKTVWVTEVVKLD
jgi:hypothetical protein